MTGRGERESKREGKKRWGSRKEKGKQRWGVRELVNKFFSWPVKIFSNPYPKPISQ